MAKTKFLMLTTTPQEVVAVSVCPRITVKEDEGVANWPTIAILIQKPGSTDDAETLTAGKSYLIERGKPFQAGEHTGIWLSVASASTTGIQDEP